MYPEDERHRNPATLVTPRPFGTCISMTTMHSVISRRNDKPTSDEGEKDSDDTDNALRFARIRRSEEGHMCPACIASTAVMVAGAGSTGGILAVCIGKFRKFFRTNRLGLFQKTQEK